MGVIFMTMFEVTIAIMFFAVIGILVTEEAINEEIDTDENMEEK